MTKNSFVAEVTFKQISELLFPLKSSENHRLSGDFNGNLINSLLFEAKFADDP